MIIYIVTTYSSVCENLFDSTCHRLNYDDKTYNHYAEKFELVMSINNEPVTVCDVLGLEDEILEVVNLNDVNELRFQINSYIDSYLSKSYPDNRLHKLYNIRNEDSSLWIYGTLNYTGGTTNLAVTDISHKDFISNLISDVVSRERKIGNEHFEIRVLMHNRDFSHEGGDRIIEHENYQKQFENGVLIDYYAFSHVNEGLGALIGKFQSSDVFNLASWVGEAKTSIDTLKIASELKNNTNDYYKQ